MGVHEIFVLSSLSVVAWWPSHGDGLNRGLIIADWRQCTGLILIS